MVIRQDPVLGLHLLNFAAAKTTSGSEISRTTERKANHACFTVERSTRLVRGVGFSQQEQQRCRPKQVYQVIE